MQPQAPSLATCSWADRTQLDALMSTMDTTSGPRFRGVRTLGKGSTGFVQLAIDNKHDGQPVAIKYIPRSGIRGHFLTKGARSNAL